MNIKRAFTHLFTTRRTIRKYFSTDDLKAIEQAITASEGTHSGEICFSIESSLPLIRILQGQTARDRAIETFALQGVWDTEQNNGVLLYLLLADHDVEIVADRGIDKLVTTEGWEKICHAMEQCFRDSQFKEGALEGIELVTTQLQKHYASSGGERNELADKPVIL